MPRKATVTLTEDQARALANCVTPRLNDIVVDGFSEEFAGEADALREGRDVLLTGLNRLMSRQNRTFVSDCTHGLTFHEERARFMVPADVRRKWPRFDGFCDTCGFKGVAYMNRAHEVLGGWG